jgi:hypothetical protein
VELSTSLRPIERRMIRLDDDGVPRAEIGRRFRRSPEYVDRVLVLAHLPGRAAQAHAQLSHGTLGRGERALRPLERCVLGWRDRGASHDEIAPMFRRSPAFVAQVEELARYKLSR